VADQAPVPKRAEVNIGEICNLADRLIPPTGDTGKIDAQVPAEIIQSQVLRSGQPRHDAHGVFILVHDYSARKLCHLSPPR
jgi:hypothetical protein